MIGLNTNSALGKGVDGEFWIFSIKVKGIV